MSRSWGASPSWIAFSLTASGWKWRVRRSGPRYAQAPIPPVLAACEVLVFLVKSNDTESTGREVAPHIAPSAPVLSFQNGIDNAERLARILDRPAILVSVYVAAELLGPGHVRHNGRGDLMIDASASSDRIAAVFRDALIPASVSDDVRRSLWQKLTVNCVYNALSAIARTPYGQITAEDGVEDLMREVIHECDAVGTTEGLQLLTQEWRTFSASPERCRSNIPRWRKISREVT